MPEAVLVVCPGRGTYGAGELGYLKRHHGGAALLDHFDAARSEREAPMVSALDAATTYSTALHGSGENASPLIFAAGLLDFLSLDRERAEVVAVCGNSMGWYTALVCARVVSPEHGFAIADAMGVNSGMGQTGGQVLLTLVGDDWLPQAELRRQVDAIVGGIDGLHRSIDLGGMLLVAGTDAALDALGKALPELPGRPPLRLAGHGPFHTPLMVESARRARAEIPLDWFTGPALPLVDGRGRIWRPRAAAPAVLYEYTFGEQILEPYDFTASLAVAIKEFAPDRVVLLGPGETMGGAIAQVLIAERWLGIADKAAFVEGQKADPFLVAMNRPDQRQLVAYR